MNIFAIRESVEYEGEFDFLYSATLKALLEGIVVHCETKMAECETRINDINAVWEKTGNEEMAEKFWKPQLAALKDKIDLFKELILLSLLIDDPTERDLDELMTHHSEFANCEVVQLELREETTNG